MADLDKNNEIVKKYWTHHNVTNHYMFNSVDESLEFLDWRNKCYLYYSELMPTSQADNKVVLDYGCGPGHDLVGFSINSKPKKLIAADVSSTSLSEAYHRLKLHGREADFIDLSTYGSLIPLPDHSVDIIHTSGVLHHIVNPLPILQEFKRILKPQGSLQLMVYNYESIWVHLYVAYEIMIGCGGLKDKIMRKFGFKRPHKNLEIAFQSTTDGKKCPVSRFYKRTEFIDLLQQAGFKGLYKGASISFWMEMNRLSRRFEAIADRKLPRESRDFLYNLTFDDRGAPIYEGFCAGIGGCYKAMHL